MDMQFCKLMKNILCHNQKKKQEGIPKNVLKERDLRLALEDFKVMFSFVPKLADDQWNLINSSKTDPT